MWGDFVVSRFAVEGKSIESEFKWIESKLISIEILSDQYPTLQVWMALHHAQGLCLPCFGPETQEGPSGSFFELNRFTKSVLPVAGLATHILQFHIHRPRKPNSAPLPLGCWMLTGPQLWRLTGKTLQNCNTPSVEVCQTWNVGPPLQVQSLAQAPQAAQNTSWQELARQNTLDWTTVDSR